jgi:hypothetical protein
MSMHPEPTTLLFENREGLLSSVHEAANRVRYVVSIRRTLMSLKAVSGRRSTSYRRIETGIQNGERMYAAYALRRLVPDR